MQSIKDLGQKIKPFYNLFLILVIASIFFALGRISAILDRKEPIKIVNSGPNMSANVVSATSVTESENPAETPVVSTSGEVVGSKNSDKYYFPWCGTAKRINPDNLVKFASIEEARKAGYTPGGNCKGLK